MFANMSIRRSFMSVPMQLYVVGGVEILLPVIALIVLRRIHKYRIASVISGIGSYFLAANLLMSMVSMLLASVGLDQQFWLNHELISEIVNVILNVLLQNLTIYLVMKFVLKGNIRIYDAIALGVSYWLGNALMLSTSAVSYARIASMSSAGRLNEMVTESLSLESLQQYASDLETLGTSSFYIQMLAVFVLSIMTAVLCVFLFHAIKRKNKNFLFMSMGGHLVLLTLLNMCLVYGGNVWYIVANAVVAVVSILVFSRYWKWYKDQQAELIRKKQEYKQRLKTVTGNVVSVKPAEEGAQEELKEEE